MGLSVRHFLFPVDGDPQRLSQRLVDGLIRGDDAIPEYAGSRQKVMSVILENNEGQPERILKTEGSIWVFDDEGKIRDGLQDALRYALESFPSLDSGDPKVVNIGPEISRKRLAAKYRWEPEQAHLERVIADIWPRGNQQKLSPAKGTAPKRPPLTWDAKRALEETAEPFFKISRAIDHLKEPSLKGFIFEARERSERWSDDRALNRALAEIAEHRLKILQRRRSGKGVWFASVDITRWNDEHGEVIASFHERCEGRDAAVRAARRLLVLHADKFSADTTVEAEIVTDLEWEDLAKRSTDGSE